MKLIQYFEFSNKNSFKIKNEFLIYKIDKIEYSKQKIIDSDEILFKTVSPILIENEIKKAILLTDDSVNKHINFNLKRIFSLLDLNLKKTIEIIPVSVNKQIIKHTFSNLLKCNSTLPYLNLHTTEGVFIMKGDKIDLDIIRNIGLGNRTSQGFGMIEVFKKN